VFGPSRGTRTVHTTIRKKKHPCLRRVSNPQSRQASGSRPSVHLCRTFLFHLSRVIVIQNNVSIYLHVEIKWWMTLIWCCHKEKKNVLEIICAVFWTSILFCCITFVARNNITRIVLRVTFQIVLRYYRKLKHIVQVLRQVQNVEKFGNSFNRWTVTRTVT